MSIAVAMVGLALAAHAAVVDTGWVQFDLRKDGGNAYVYPRLANGSWGHVFSGRCQFNALVLTDGSDLHDMLHTAKEQRLRVNLWYDDADGPVCRLAHLHIEWAE
jgi:hypothetical protein